MTFDPGTIEVEPIREEALYDGLRVNIGVQMGKAKTRLQLDVGFGDATVPPPEEISFPTLLDLPAPKLRAYARETVVAEKFEAMVTLGMSNSRMKDFFDIWYLSRTFEFDDTRLAHAVRTTFERRGTALPLQLPVGLSRAFSRDEAKTKEWNAFVRRLGLHQDVTLEEVVDHVSIFLEPILILARDGAVL